MIPSELLRRYSQVFVPGSMGSRAAEFLCNRRRFFLKNLSGTPVVVAGVDNEPGTENVWGMNWIRIFQDPAMLYFCGINQPGFRLFFDPEARSESRVVLFVPPKNPSREFWDGVRLGLPKKGSDNYGVCLEELRTLTGIRRILPAASLENFLQKRLRGESRVGSLFHEYRDSRGEILSQKSDHSWVFREFLIRMSLGGKKSFRVDSVMGLVLKQRLILDKWQQTDVTSAQKKSRSAFLKVLPLVLACGFENILAEKLECELRKGNPSGLAFPSIVAGGKNACTLHYLKRDEKLKQGELVLLDFGARHAAMHSDISRTLPVSGRFNPLQRLLYEIVLRTQTYHQSLVCPGITMEKVDKKVWNFLENSLEKEFLSRGGRMKRYYKRKPHGVSHLMGEQIHDGDPFRLYLSEPLQEGMMLSSEPGLYGWFSMRIDGRRWQGHMGIRIEDDLLVTKTGCRCLSSSIPRKVEELEKLLATEEMRIAKFGQNGE